ncbi:winged helix-turn-helix transcriptional regulator [Promicromonospora sp. NPDC050880]|uniref:winged helix-turn-helix transcriptional regulator n=1 Tax=Promicromonospora sp. NPDC050880 TaxID=3364406 RepID=UPI0037AFCB17
MENGKTEASAEPDGLHDVFHTDCAARQVLDHVTSRWGVWVLIRLGERPLRFYELRDRIEGISEKMLSQTLRNLVQDDLVWRTVEPTAPPTVTYGLTPSGTGLGERLAALLDWIESTFDESGEAAEPSSVADAVSAVGA